jgi:Permuted papain-like amidase enzyme, YaeF/YiiX, C92 family
MWSFIWCLTTIFGGHDGLEPTDRLIPPGWKGNPWGPVASRARATGEIPPIPMTPLMKQWDQWGRTVLRDGDILLRRGDARLLFGHFPFSRFIAKASGSLYSHTGIVSVEGGAPFVYDTTKAGVRRQPFSVWILDNAGPFGVKRVRPELAAHAAAAVRFCRAAFERQVPFDYELSLDDRAFYCVEMTEKAYRSSGLPLSEPIRLGDMENMSKFPVCVFVFLKISDLKLDQLVYFPGNERHGIWSSKNLVTVYPPATPAGPRDLGRVEKQPSANGEGQKTASRDESKTR